MNERIKLMEEVRKQFRSNIILVCSLSSKIWSLQYETNSKGHKEGVPMPLPSAHIHKRSMACGRVTLPRLLVRYQFARAAIFLRQSK